MSKKNIFIIALSLIVGMTALWLWLMSPTQVVHRQANALLDLARFQRISVETRERKLSRIEQVFAPRAEISLPPILSTSEYGYDELLAFLEEAQLYVSMSEVEELERKIAFDEGKNRADLILRVQAHITSGANHKKSHFVRLFLTFEKQANWKLTRLEGHEEDPTASYPDL